MNGTRFGNFLLFFVFDKSKFLYLLFYRGKIPMIEKDFDESTWKNKNILIRIVNYYFLFWNGTILYNRTIGLYSVARLIQGLASLPKSGEPYLITLAKLFYLLC